MFDPISHNNQYRQSTSTSSNFDVNSSDRMKMDYLKKEKERREKERYKMEYDIKKKDFDMHNANKVRFELDKKRIDIELGKYKTDILTALRDEKKYSIEKNNISEEEKQVNQKIQSLEIELQQLKNKSQKLKQDKESADRKDRDLMGDLNKRNTYVKSLELKLTITEKNLSEANREVGVLSSDLTRLKRYI
jgi:chromosome segregation ATPase